jgi:hypothetical protein
LAEFVAVKEHRSNDVWRLALALTLEDTLLRKLNESQGIATARL